jgi:hypothetical protein
VSEKYEFIDAECATLPADGEAAPTIVQMCGWLGVSNSGFHDWRTRPPSGTAQRRKLLEIKVKALFEANNSEYGYRRIHAALVRGGESVDDETVRKIMRDLGLEPCQPKPWRFSLTEQDGQAARAPAHAPGVGSDPRRPGTSLAASTVIDRSSQDLPAHHGARKRLLRQQEIGGGWTAFASGNHAGHEKGQLYSQIPVLRRQISTSPPDPSSLPGHSDPGWCPHPG